MSEVFQKKFKISISAVLLLCLMVLFVIYSSSLFLIRDARAAAVAWDGGGDGVSWEDALNWSGDAVPTAVDDVTIDSNVTVDIGPSVAPSAILQFAMNDNAASTVVVDATATTNGTADQNTSILTTTGKISSALTFNGSTDHVDVSFTIPTEDFTYATWVNLDTNNDEIIFDAANTTSNEFYIYIVGGKVSTWINGATVMTSTSSVATGGWHHVAVTRNGGLVKTYIDGTLDATTGTKGDTLDFEGCQGTIGAGANCTTDTANWFDGAMDDFRVYGEALGTYEISQIYNSGTGTEAALSSNRASTINSLTLGNSGGTTSSTLRFIYDAVGASDALAIDAVDLTVHTGATVSTTYGSPSIYFDVQTGNATIDGTVSADYWGYGGSGGPEAGTEVNNYGGGAGHGGSGGTAQGSLAAQGVGGGIYGSVTAPVTAGSGGGSADNNAGGLGGGVIRMDVAGNTDIDGTITADGLLPVTNRNPGGGAGGSVYITTVGTLTGTGSIGANGGNGDALGAGGAGGRIALHYDVDTSSITETAYGGTSESCGSCFGGAGTIYLNDTTGADTSTLIIDNNSSDSNNDFYFGRTPLTPSGTPASFTYDNLILQNDGQLDLNSDTTLTVNSGITWSGDGTLVDNGGSFDFISNSSNSLTLPTGAKLYANTARTFVNINVNSGATVTGSNNSTTGAGKVYEINLTATGNVTIDGTIDLLAKGYKEDNGPQPGANTTTTAVGGGGGHGGQGGDSTTDVGGTVYGSITAPITLGSGGATDSGNAGGDGGGAVRIDVAGNTDIDGTISVNAGSAGGNRQPGGGAGGSVYITTVGTLTGTGSITANGGNGDETGGGGSGGRIALHYDADTSTITETAYGGTSPSCGHCFGGAGTVYLNDTTGADTDTLVIDNNSLDSAVDYYFGRTLLTPVGTPASFTYDNLILQNDGQLDINSDTTLTINTGITWSGDGTLVDNGGTFDFISNSSNSLTLPTGAKLYANTARTYVNINVDSGATITGSNNETTGAGKVYEIYLTATGNLTIDGTVYSDYKGYYSANGPEPGTEVSNYGGGAGHGGTGGTANNYLITTGLGGDVYGSVTAPITIGSGGSTAAGNAGGYGGGAVRFTVGGNTDIDGTITADGTTPVTNRSPGGGAGGSVYITTVGTLTGTGTIGVNGGNGDSSGSGGAGGRIALHFDEDTSTITETAYGGTSESCSYCFGGAGTIYLNDTTGADTSTLVIDNNSLDSWIDYFFGYTPLTPSGTPLSLTVTNVNVQNKGYLDLNSDTTLTNTSLTYSSNGIILDNGGTMTNVTSGDVSIPSGATLFANTTRTYDSITVGGILGHSANLASAVYSMDLTTTNDFIVSSGGVVNVNSQGYKSKSGTGAGEDSGSYGSGAGHGGAGGITSDGGSTAGGTYDFTGLCSGGACDTASPTTLGSGGGEYSTSYYGGPGGGAIKLTIGGNFTLTGDMTANGGGPYTNGGGGSGGSVWLNITGNAIGAGTLSADGGDGSVANSGAGGGGRISITCASDASWTAAVSVDAGSVGGAGSSGTLYDDCSGGLPPTSSVNAAAQKTNGSGHVDLSIELDDVEDDDVKLKIEYETDSDASCNGPWSAATLTGTATADFNDTGGAPDVGVGAYQVGSVATKRVITSSGPNNVHFDWDSKADLPSANGTQCLRFTANDDATDATPVTQTLTVDNVIPTVASSISYKDITVVDGTVDRVDVVFTENVTLSSYNTADWAFTTPGSITLDDTGASVSTTTVRLTVTADANETGGSTAPTLSYTNNSRLTDTYGNELASFGPTTVTDSAGPFILSTDPADGATDTAIGDDVVITFTEAINTATDAYTWSDAPAGVTDAWTASDTVITISHSESFSIGSHTFTMTVAADGTGNALAGAVSGVANPISFATVAAASGSTVVSYVSNNAVVINEGDECSASRTVVLQLTAKKAASVLIGHDDLFQDSIRVDFVSDTMINNVPVMFYTWTMNEGEDTVYVQYRSSTNTASSRVSDSIVVDTINLCIEHIDSDETTEAPLTDVLGVSPITGEAEAISEVNAHDYIQGDFFTDIYYVDSEINRHPLVDPRTILTWGKDLSVIKHVTDATLGTLGIGKLFLPKPGTTLLKFLDDPDIFTIDENAGDFYHPILRHIPNEKTAEKMFGSNWQDYIYELNQAHFHEFAIGKKIPEEGIVIDISQLILLK